MNLKKLLLLSCLLSTFAVSANNSAISPQYFYHPETAPKIKRCKGNDYCNAFYALSRYWQKIPNSYRYEGFDIKKQARKGDGYGLHKGYTFSTEQAVNIAMAGADVFWRGGESMETQDEAIFGYGLAVLLYLEDTLGLIKHQSY